MAIVEQVERVSAREREAVVVLTPRNVAAPGFAHTVRWASVAGATSAEVQEASVFLAPRMVSETQQDVPFSNDGGWIVTIPKGKRVKALTLRGLKRSGGNEITGSDGLADLRLAVSFPPVQGSGWDSPRFSVPPVGRQKMVPRTLTGASFSNRVLT